MSHGPPLPPARTLHYAMGMSKASVLIVFLRDSLTDWADEHGLSRYATVLRWSPRRSSHF